MSHRFELAETIDLSPSELDKFLGRSNGSIWPEIRRSRGGEALEDINEVISRGQKEGRLGLDLEFSGMRPTILGVSSRDLAVGVPWDDNLARLVLDSEVQLVGHATTDADKPVIDNRFDITTHLSDWGDTMIQSYLCNSDWCAAPGKDEDEQDGGGALGLMNLYTMASFYLGVPQWKICRGEKKEYGGHCDGPCPRHDPFGYCSCDSWTGLMCSYRLDEDMAVKGIPQSLYRDLQRLTVYCSQMTAKGVKVDKDLVRNLESEFERRKQSIFPNEVVKGKKVRFGSWSEPDSEGEITWTPAEFNPRAPKACAEWFEKHGITLRDRGGKISIGKAVVQKALGKVLKPLGYKYNPGLHLLETNDSTKENPNYIEDNSVVLPDAIRELIKLAQYKGSGKGLSSWFDDRYIDRNSFAHPRFIVTGTSTGRLSSSKPNFQNIPRVGFGSLVRRVIVPRERGLCLVKADASQLELRVCLWYAGLAEGNFENPTGDAFTWLVQQTNGQFERIGERLNIKPRDITKSVSHAFNYLEGLIVLYEKDLQSDRRQKEISEGALLVFDGKANRSWWPYRGGVVGFTGANLAERLFGNRTNASRKLALEIQEIYSNRFPQIRRWHMGLSKEIEASRAVKSHTGRYIALYGSPEEDLKLAAAFKGQGGGADYVQEGMLIAAEMGEIATLQVHDELLFEKPLEWSDAQCVSFMNTIMSHESRRFPGFKCPIKVYRGLRWREADKENPNEEDMKEIKL